MDRVEGYRFTPSFACSGKSKLFQNFTVLRRTPRCFALQNRGFKSCCLKQRKSSRSENL